MDFFETILKLCSLEIDHEGVTASEIDLTAVGPVRTALRGCRYIPEKIFNMKDIQQENDYYANK